MPALLPGYLSIPAARLGEDTRVVVTICGDAADVAVHMADAMLQILRDKPAATLIVPVGPVDQFPLLARRINDERVDCREAVFINMDEYLTDDDCWLPTEHPLSFRGYMDRQFYGLLDPSLAPRPEQRVFPSPKDPEAIGRLIAARDGVDACFGGIGINGHIAFNEPPEPGETISLEVFADLPTRALTLSRETRTINSVTTGGEIAVVPQRAVTVGMREILSSRQLRFYCNRSWQCAVVRRLLHGPVTPACPASLLRMHTDASLAIADFVAQPPDIRLR